MNYLGLTDADYDEKLREMGNYLWDLEQEADLASAEGRQALVEEIEAKILARPNARTLSSKSPGITRFWPRLWPALGIG